MFGVVCTIAHQKHSCILDVSSQSSRSSSCVIYLFLLYTTSATSDNILHDTGEGIADRNQDPVKRNLAGGTVWPSGRLLPLTDVVVKVTSGQLAQGVEYSIFLRLAFSVQTRGCNHVGFLFVSHVESWHVVSGLVC